MVKEKDKIIVRLTSSGGIEELIVPSKLTQDSYNFVKLRCLVPVLPTYPDDTYPYKTVKVYRSDTDTAGQVVWTGEPQNLPRSREEKFAVVGNTEYEVYESVFPSAFCRESGALNLTFAYGVSQDNAQYSAILTSETVRLYVGGVGLNAAGVELADSDQTAAAVNDANNTASEAKALASQANETANASNEKAGQAETAAKNAELAATVAQTAAQKASKDAEVAKHRSPYVDKDDGYWYEFDADEDQFVNTTVEAQGERGTKWYTKNTDPDATVQPIKDDQWLNSATGSVWYYDGQTWLQTGNIKGPQGVQGKQGERGKPGAPFQIVGKLNSASELPPPTEEIRSNAYLIPGNIDLDLWVIMGEATLTWENTGTVTEGPPGPAGLAGGIIATSNSAEWLSEDIWRFHLSSKVRNIVQDESVYVLMSSDNSQGMALGDVCLISVTSVVSENEIIGHASVVTNLRGYQGETGLVALTYAGTISSSEEPAAGVVITGLFGNDFNRAPVEGDEILAECKHTGDDADAEKRWLINGVVSIIGSTPTGQRIAKITIREATLLNPDIENPLVIKKYNPVMGADLTMTITEKSVKAVANDSATSPTVFELSPGALKLRTEFEAAAYFNTGTIRAPSVDINTAQSDGNFIYDLPAASGKIALENGTYPGMIVGSATSAISASSAIRDGAQNVIVDTYAKKSALLDLIYPVGSIYMNLNSTNPATLFGGTWVQIKDRFLLAAGTTYSANSTGGEASHTLTTSEMPSHTHTQASHTHSNAAHTHGLRSGTDWSTAVGGLNAATNKSQIGAVDGGTNGLGYYYKTLADNVDWVQSVSISIGSSTPTIYSSGGGQAHNNMPPYMTVYVWRRTA